VSLLASHAGIWSRSLDQSCLRQLSDAVETAREQFEKEYILSVLERVEGSRTTGAKILGLSRKALWEKCKCYGIPSAREEAEDEGLMIFCTRATRGRGLPSLDARSGRSISSHPWKENEQAWKGQLDGWCSFDARGRRQAVRRSTGGRGETTDRTVPARNKRRTESLSERLLSPQIRVLLFNL